jgi:hypothetical protein
MAADEFFTLVRSWLTVHLPRARRLSPHTIRSYKTAINTLLTYLAETRQLKLAEVSFEVIDRATITPSPHGYSTPATSARPRRTSGWPPSNRSCATARERTRHSSQSGWTSNKPDPPGPLPARPTR